MYIYHGMLLNCHISEICVSNKCYNACLKCMFSCNNKKQQTRLVVWWKSIPKIFGIPDMNANLNELTTFFFQSAKLNNLLFTWNWNVRVLFICKCSISVHLVLDVKVDLACRCQCMHNIMLNVKKKEVLWKGVKVIWQ